MSKNYQWCVTLASALLVVLVAESRLALGQRTVSGGGNSQSNRDRDKDKDEEDDEDEDRDNNRGNRSSKSGNRTQDQINRLLQGGQGGKGGQGGQPGQDGQGGRGGRGGQGGSGGDDDDYREGDFGQSGRDGRSGQFQNRGQSDFQRLFRPKEGTQNVRLGGWQGDRWQGSRDVNNWSQVFAGGKQPFSAEWHKEHPKAWQHEHHDHDDIWVVATLPGVYSWLSWGNVPPQAGVRIGPPPDLSRFHDFYPLGVYSLMSGPGDMGTRVVQLAIDRHGHIAGNYYDMITDTNSSVSGEVKRESQRVYWSLNKNKSIRFRVSLNRLVQPYGMMTVQLPGGEQDWQFVRLEN